MHIGIDLGGTNIDAGLVSEQGILSIKKSVPTRPERGSIGVIKDIIRIIKELSCSGEIQGVGIGIPGAVIRDKGIVDFACNINFQKVPLRDELNKHFDYPIYLDNDANCAALGEAICGVAKDFDTSITATIGTGIGGGFIINKRIYRGFNDAAGEIGHMVIETNGLHCTCGRKGCFEKYASTAALVEQAINRLKKQSDSIIMDIVSGEYEKINGKIIFSAAKQEDKTALLVIDQYINYLAEGLANLINIFEPQIIVIGGAICQQGEYLLGPLRKKIYKLIYSKTLPKTKIEAAILGSDSGIIGAGHLWKD